MQVTGLCLGAATVSMVTVAKTDEGVKVLERAMRSHEGDLRRTLLGLLAGRKELRLCTTGRKFRHLLQVVGIAEPEAVEYAYNHYLSQGGQPVDAIVSAGGETFILYLLDGRGKISSVQTGNKCASGTGEFFLQQVQRMGLTPGEALDLAAGHEPYPVAGRCSVFCKSDCTHALNKGEAKGRVVAGLCRMMADKILELVARVGAQRVLLVGGTSRNRPMLDFLREQLEIHIPPEASNFEALGAALWGLAQGSNLAPCRPDALFTHRESSFTFLPPLVEAKKRVDYKTMDRGDARPGDKLLLGLDVGSTTTKAVLVRRRDKALVASVYLRTDGDPVAAARRCYRELAAQVPAAVKIAGLGVTGSGRRIAGLHALTAGIVNEIIAHARAALYFDPQVDTILEIGGQDAKYTYLVNGVPADYAMNEACSAGTGSFLEEAAWESLQVKVDQIAPLAFQCHRPPNFNDQCAAFIGSDVKTAVQEGVPMADIVGGLVYSICFNYLTRVRGNRPVGRKIYMQGGVCYNQAVPAAMAALLDREVVVPPEPGLMGAFGVALVVEDRLSQGALAEETYDLAELAGREVAYDRSFICSGDAGCDRSCTIKILRIRGRAYPFGGACSRYSDGMVRPVPDRAGSLDLVAWREKLFFTGTPAAARRAAGPTVGVSRALLVNNLYPLYYHFFTALGCRVVTADIPAADGRRRQGASFCYPVELAHGFAANLLAKRPDWIFLPQVKGIPGGGGSEAAVTCPLAQGEPYYLQAAFPQLREEGRLLAPVLDFSRGYAGPEEEFVTMGASLGADRSRARQAFQAAVARQEALVREFQARGAQLLQELEKENLPGAVVIFGRAYNAFAGAANMGIPHKFASRGWPVIPYDFLPWQAEEPFPHMYWAAGQAILQAARLVRCHPRLFGVYITNFSCGPDSFLMGYFREIMGDKPSLTLELDGHTADAGLDTRVEAFLDIVAGRERGSSLVPAPTIPNRSITLVERGRAYVKSPQGKKLSLNHPQVKLLIPAMGEEGSRYLAAVFARAGVRAQALPAPGERELKLGRSHTTCKECLPLQLTVGSLLRYLEENPVPAGEQLVYFMPETSGPCRFGQYQVFINRLLDRLGIANVATLSLSSENSYGGLGPGFTLRAWAAILIADVMAEIYSSLLVLARKREEALAVYRESCRRIEAALSREGIRGIRKTLTAVAADLAQVELAQASHQAPRVALLGEIYVRADGFSRHHLVEYLADRGIITRVAPVHEWLYYCDHLLQQGYLRPYTPWTRWKNRLQRPVKVRVEKEVKGLLAASGLYDTHLVDIPHRVAGVEHLIAPALTGEAILTVAGALWEVVDQVAGVIALGPFGCMPNRIAEAIIGQTLNYEKIKTTTCPDLTRRVLAHHPHLPFMAIETDGSIFPQVVEARLESFVLQVKRLHGTIGLRR